MRRWVLRFATVLALVGAGLPSAARASMGVASLEGSESGMIEGKLVSAHVVFSVTGQDNKLHILLTNMGTRCDYAVAHILTDINFNLEGADFDFEVGPGTGSSVSLGSGSTLYYGSRNASEQGEGFDVSSEWGLARNTTLLPSDGYTENLGPFDYSVTAATFGGSEVLFGSGSLDGQPPGLGGGDFGLLNAQTAPAESPFQNHEVIVNSVEIVLSATRPLLSSDLSYIKNPTFSYGSTHTAIVGLPDDVVPEPSALAVWLLIGLTWAGSSWMRRRRGAGG
jgi:hypothetical protein